MIEARRALYAHLRDFVERELGGLFTWNDVRDGVTLPSELVGKHKNRRNPLGPVKEIVEIKVGAYVVRAFSSQEKGPCGRVEVEFPDETPIEIGPLDQATFSRLGEMIRERESTRV